MNVITHALIGWCTAEGAPDRFGQREKALITLAALAPDIDGFGLPFELLTRDSSRPLLWWTEFHHVLGHNLTFAAMVALVCAAAAHRARVLTAFLAFVSVHLHILGDVLGSRGPDGYQWPIPYLWPWSPTPVLTWSGQWALNAWPNFALTIALMAWTSRMAWKRGYSVVSLISARADRAFISVLRARFGSP